MIVGKPSNSRSLFLWGRLMMSNITYGRDEIISLFSSWSTIMETWDDNKSHDIDSKFLQSILQSTRQLMEFSDEIHTIVNELADEIEGV